MTRTRAVAFFHDIADAENAIQESLSNEAGAYTHIIIEEIKPGIMAEVVNEFWYVFNESRNPTWEICEKPAEVSQVVNFGLG